MCVPATVFTRLYTRVAILSLVSVVALHIIIYNNNIVKGATVTFVLCPVIFEVVISADYFICDRRRRALKNYRRIDSSTPTHRDRKRREKKVVYRPDSRASGEFDATVRFPPLDPFRLHSRAKPRDYASLNAVARRIVAARTRPYVPASQTSFLRFCARRSRIPAPDSFAVSPLRTPLPSRIRRCQFARRFCRTCSEHTHSLVRVPVASVRQANEPLSISRSLRLMRTRRCLSRFSRGSSQARRFSRLLPRQLRFLPRLIQCRRSRSLSRRPSLSFRRHRLHHQCRRPSCLSCRHWQHH